MTRRFEWVLVSALFGIGGVAACSSSEPREEPHLESRSTLGADARGDATATSAEDGGSACGAPGQACCGDPDAGSGTCQTGALCNLPWNNVCTACGQRGQLCCGSSYHSPDGYCTEAGTECDLEGAFECTAPKDLCGATGQTCCASGVSDHSCDAIWAQCGGPVGPTGICTECGGYNQACCRPYYDSQAPGNCQDGSSCPSSGRCGVPF